MTAATMKKAAAMRGNSGDGNDRNPLKGTIMKNDTSVLVTTDMGRRIDPDSLEMQTLCNGDQQTVGDPGGPTRADIIVNADTGPEREDEFVSVPCDNPHCIDDEHDIPSWEPGETGTHVAARAKHGAVQLEVYLEHETGLWVLDIYCHFDGFGGAVTHDEAIALADDIRRFADLTQNLNIASSAHVKHLRRRPDATEHLAEYDG